MWDVIKVVNGEVERLATHDSVDKCKSQFPRSKDQGIWYVWSGEFPKTEAEQLSLVKSVSEANDGIQLMVTIGLDFDSVKKVPGLSRCSGRCFCVIANGMRRCEVQYCNVNHYCWWVPCGSNC
jgi:hypothetical protein